MKRTPTPVFREGVCFLSAIVFHHELKLTRLPVVRDVRERGRDIEGIIKQWFGFVKPNFEKVT